MIDIIIGAYDSYISGFVAAEETDASEAQCVVVKHKFSDFSHKGCVKCLEVSNTGILASGSTDETVQIFDLGKNMEVGTLVSHEGDITCLKFVGKDFLYSSSADGTIRMWKNRIWELQRTLHAHKAAVVSFDIHPSTKLALSISADHKLVLWDLVASKYSFVRNMKKPYESVHFNVSGAQFVLNSGTFLDVFTLGEIDPEASIDVGSRIGQVACITDDLFVVGADDGKIHLISVSERKPVATLTEFSKRVRGVSILKSSDPDRVLLVCCSSDHTIRILSVTLSKKSAVVIAQGDTEKSTITCMTAYATVEKVDRILKLSDGLKAEQAEKKSQQNGSDLSVTSTKNSKSSHSKKFNLKTIQKKDLKKLLKASLKGK